MHCYRMTLQLAIKKVTLLRGFDWEQHMAKLHFYYSAMNAGKSTTLLQSSFNYHERGMDTLLYLPEIDTRHHLGHINSRIGLSEEAKTFSANFNLYDDAAKKTAANNNIKCIFN